MSDDGYICIERNKFVLGDEAVLEGIKECPFVEVCKPKEKILLNSIHRNLLVF